MHPEIFAARPSRESIFLVTRTLEQQLRPKSVVPHENNARQSDRRELYAHVGALKDRLAGQSPSWCDRSTSLAAEQLAARNFFG